MARNTQTRLMFSQEDSHVSLSPLQEREASTLHSGRRCLESLSKLNHLPSWQRMFLELLVEKTRWHSELYALTWKLQGTKSSHLIFRLRAKVLHTKENEYGLLLTPTASDAKIGLGKIAGRNAHRLYSTSNGTIRIKGKKKGSHGTGLVNQIAVLPTVTSSASRGAFSENSAAYKNRLKNPRGVNLAEHFQRLNSGKKTGLVLHPDFVEWMMGYPIGWTR